MRDRRFRISMTRLNSSRLTSIRRALGMRGILRRVRVVMRSRFPLQPLKPFSRRRDDRLGSAPRTRTTGSFEPADCSDAHVVITKNLTRQSHSYDPARREHGLFGDGHPGGLAGDELHPARRAAGVAATGMEDVHTGI